MNLFDSGVITLFFATIIAAFWFLPASFATIASEFRPFFIHHVFFALRLLYCLHYCYLCSEFGCPSLKLLVFSLWFIYTKLICTLLLSTLYFHLLISQLHHCIIFLTEECENLWNMDDEVLLRHLSCFLGWKRAIYEPNQVLVNPFEGKKNQKIVFLHYRFD